MNQQKPLIVFFLALLAAAATLGAQSGQDHSAVRLTGRVIDENKAPLSGAEVSLRLDAQEVHAFADPTGAFTLDVPSPGTYSVKVSLPGYFDLSNRVIALNPGFNELTLVLPRVRERLESVDVSGATAIIDLDKTVREQQLSGADLIDVPFRNNNDLRNAMRVLPGVVQDQHDGIHVNGAGEQQVLYTLNGFNIADPLTGTFQSRLAVEAVQSMSVLSGSVPAEYGKGAAGVLAINTKIGDDRVRYSATDFIPGVEYRKGLIIGSWKPRFDISGPLRKGKIWFDDSFATQYSQDVISGLPAGQDKTSSWRFTNMFRTQVNLTPSNILHAGFLANYWTSPNSGLSALDPPQTTVDMRASQWFYDVKDQIYFGHGSLAEFGYASNRTYGRQIPQGTDLYQYTPLGRRGNYFVDGKQRSSRDQWLANYFLPAFTRLGSHQIKIGADLDRLYYWQDIRRTGFIYYRTDNSPAREVVYAGSGLLNRSNFETSAYIQDSWRVRPGLLVEIGVRTDRDQILRNWTLAPRFGFAWSPWKGDRSKISGGYGIIYSATNLVLFTRPADQYPVTTYFPLDGGLPFSTVSSYVIDRSHLATPRYQNFHLGWEQRFESGFVASIQGLGRIGTHGLSYFDTTGLSPAATYALQDGRRDEYTAVEWTIRQNLRRRYQWLLSYTHSLSRSNAVLDFNADQPLIVADNSGRLPWDAPNRIVSWGFLPTFWKSWSIAYLAEYHTGFPYSIRNDTGVVIGGVNAYRFPDFFELDLALERQFDFRHQRWAWRMGLNNLTNHQNPDFVNDQIGSPNFRQFYGAQGRAVTFRVRWLGKT